MSDKPERKKPARWRKARNPHKGGRWSTPTNNFIWQRDHGADIELWRGDVHLATVRPVERYRSEGPWEWRHNVGQFDGWHKARNATAAKARAKEAALGREAAQGVQP